MSLLTTIIFLLISKNLPCIAEDVAFRMVGGEVCDYRDYPFLMHLYAFWFCGGTLIHDEWVLTAAHCVYHYGDHRDASVHVMAGGNTDEEKIIQKREGVLVIAHPHFDKGNFDNDKDLSNDIALVRLDRPFKMTARVKVLPLPKFGKRTWKWKFTFEWGSKNEKQKSPKPEYSQPENQLTTPTTTTTTTTKYTQPTWVTTIYNGPCYNPTLVGGGDLFFEDVEIEKKKPEKLVCANFSFVHYERCTKSRNDLNPNAIFCIYDEQNKGCMGDHGGPLLCKNIGLVGVFSKPMKDCDKHKYEGIPMLVSRVDYYREWIEETMAGKKSAKLSKNNSRSGSHKILLSDSSKKLGLFILLMSKFLSGN